LQHVHSVEGQRPPYAVHDRPDKYTKLYGSTIVAFNIIKNTRLRPHWILLKHPLPITTMVLP